MARTDEAEAFLVGVYMAVQEIPHGKVTSYGHIAYLIGKPQCPRQVGQALKHLPSSSNDAQGNTIVFHNGNVPWQRVISSNGIIPIRDDPTAAARHAQALRSEGVTVTTRARGALQVDLDGFGWFPGSLPSEGSEYSDGGDD
ncbi:6-O-methylguanine DNA methyltransferase [Morchella snyderi]|nr:6-O-methylguanine DNA methyltransferase [Morchella snyderi]